MSSTAGHPVDMLPPYLWEIFVTNLDMVRSEIETNAMVHYQFIKRKQIENYHEDTTEIHFIFCENWTGFYLTLTMY